MSEVDQAGTQRHAAPMAISPAIARRAAWPLRLVTLGALIGMTRVDLSMDFAGQTLPLGALASEFGMLLLVVGVGLLARLPAGRAYRRLMWILFGLAAAWTLSGLVLREEPGMTVFGALPGSGAFVMAMGWLCRKAKLKAASASWAAAAFAFLGMVGLSLRSFSTDASTAIVSIDLPDLSGPVTVAVPYITAVFVWLLVPIALMAGAGNPEATVDR